MTADGGDRTQEKSALTIKWRDAGGVPGEWRSPAAATEEREAGWNRVPWLSALFFYSLTSHPLY